MGVLKYKKVKKAYFILVLSSLFMRFIEIFGIQVIARVIDAINANNEQKIWFYVYIFIWVCLLHYVIRFISDIFYSRFAYNADMNLTNKYLRKYINLDNTKTEGLWIWRMQTIISNGTRSRWDLILKNWVPILSNIWWIIYIMVLVFIKLEPLQVTYFIVLFGIIILFINKGISVLRKIRKEVKDMYIEIDRWKTKILMSKMEVLQQNKFHKEISSIMPKYEFILKKNDKGNIKKLSWQIWGNLILDLIKVWIFVFVWIWVLRWNYSIAEFSLLIFILWLLSKSIRTIRSEMKDYNKKIIDVEKLWDVFDNIPNIQAKESWKHFTYKHWNIKIHNLSFWYDTSPVFQNFSLQIQGWTKTAFVGESWGGKTTLIKLLAGYIRPDSGSIEVDGQTLFTDKKTGLVINDGRDLKNQKKIDNQQKDRSSPDETISLQSYYKHIGYLTQDPSVFDGTIYENLVYALDTEPPKEDLEKVVKLAKCEFIREFEKWLETEIGERWVRLSGGQKQRLAIAKIMLKNPNIILLDEPTSALDSFNEEQISIALHNLFKGKTVIVVAHRLQTVKEADRILLFEQGKIIEEGTHKELVNLNGKYKKMLELQSGF